MKYSVLLLITFTLSVESKHHKRTVNVALETSLLFEPKDIKTNLGLVNNIRTFLDKIYNTLEPQAQLAYRGNEDPKTLPDFLEHLGTKCLSFSDDRIEHFASVLRQHVQYHTSKARSSYHEIFSDPTIKTVMQSILEKISKMNGEKLRKKLHKFIKSDKPVLRSFTKRLEHYYTEEDLVKFYRFMRKLDRYARKNKDMSQVVRDWLDFGIFDRYNNLNYTSKVKLLSDMNLVRDYLNGETRFRAENESNDDDKMKENEIDVSGSDGEGVHKHHRHTAKENDKHNHKLNVTSSKEHDHDGRKTEVIVDNVEIFLKSLNE